MKHLKIGDAAPQFNSIDQNAESIALSDFTGKKVIVYFYPQDDTPTCTKEACNLRDNYTTLQEKGYEVVGISPDPVKKHKKFVDKYSLPFRLAVDEDHKIAEAFGVWGLKKFMGREYDGIHRTTFLIDEKGIIENIIEDVKSAQHAQQILDSK